MAAGIGPLYVTKLICLQITCFDCYMAWLGVPGTARFYRLFSKTCINAGVPDATDMQWAWLGQLFFSNKADWTCTPLMYISAELLAELQ